MSIIAWRTDVNTAILDSTTIETGGTGFKEDSIDNGFKQRYATSLVCSDVYSVTMDFDWLVKDENGLSEYDRFKNWFKYVHQYGANPFWFESVDRFNINGPVTDSEGKPLMCMYRITSKLNFQKSGYCMRCTMTWEEVYHNTISITDDDIEIDSLMAENGKLYIKYNHKPLYFPTPTDHTFSYCKLTAFVDGSDLSQYLIYPNVYRADLSENTAIYSVNKLAKGNYRIIVDNDMKLNCLLVVN